LRSDISKRLPSEPHVTTRVTAQDHEPGLALEGAQGYGQGLVAVGVGAVVSDATARSSAAGHAAPDALTAGFRAGFAVAAWLLIAGVLATVRLLREDGRGERVNLLELRAGASFTGGLITCR
jgi:hypothetical protein